MMNSHSSRSMVMISVACLLIAGCVNLGQSTSPATRFYLLESVIDPTLRLAGNDSLANVTMSIGPVVVPAYLNRPQLVTRIHANELRVDEFRRWAEPLPMSIARVIEANMVALTGVRQIYSWLEKPSPPANLRLSLHVLRFDSDISGRITLIVDWRVVSPGDHGLLIDKRTTLFRPSTATRTEEVVNAMSETLAELSKEIVQTMIDVTGPMIPAS